MAFGVAVVMLSSASGWLDAADARAQREPLTEGFRLVGSLPFEGGSEIAADARFVYANQLDGTTARGQYPERGGIRIIQQGREGPLEIGSIRCPGNDNDVQPLGRDLLVIAHHTSRCNPGHGLLTVDISDPRSPRVIGRLSLDVGTAHTLTPHPGGRYVYVSPGGLFNGRSEEAIVDVADPRRPEVVSTFVPGPAGCHDITFLERDRRVIGFCAGFGETSIWDVTDPLEPIAIGRIANPAVEFMYVAAPNPKGDLLAIVDEAFIAHECTAGRGPGGVWLYDISNLSAPILAGHIPPPTRGAQPVATTDVEGWCAAHGIAWHPKKPGLLAVTWYTAGVSVVDVSSPLDPVEIAFFRAGNSLAEAVIWHRGLLYSNDLRRGVDVLSLSP